MTGGVGLSEVMEDSFQRERFYSLIDSWRVVNADKCNIGEVSARDTSGGQRQPLPNKKAIV